MSTPLAGWVDHDGNVITPINTTQLKAMSGKHAGKDLPFDEDLLKYREGVDTSTWSGVQSGANIRKYSVDVDNIIDATQGKYNSYGKKPPIPQIAELDSKGNGMAQNIIDEAKKGFVNWQQTDTQAHQDVWRDILIPQLQTKGYDAIKYGDDGHETMAVFNNKSILPPVTFNPSDAEKDTAMQNILQFLQSKGVRASTGMSAPTAKQSEIISKNLMDFFEKQPLNPETVTKDIITKKGLPVKLQQRVDEDGMDTMEALDSLGNKIGELDRAPLIGYSASPYVPSQTANQFVEENYRRQGINTAMQEFMMELHPAYTPISRTLTEDGAKAAESYPKSFVDRDERIRALTEMLRYPNGRPKIEDLPY
jgi:hypothetical protein